MSKVRRDLVVIHTYIMLIVIVAFSQPYVREVGLCVFVGPVRVCECVCVRVACVSE